jgi:hypothetical protein
LNFKLRRYAEVLGGGAVPSDGAYPRVLGDAAAMTAVLDGLSDDITDTAVRAAAANIIRHSAAAAAGIAVQVNPRSTPAWSRLVSTLEAETL